MIKSEMPLLSHSILFILNQTPIINICIPYTSELLHNLWLTIRVFPLYHLDFLQA